jgi:DNA-binding LacI/PurR family transcriptional regulator
MKKHTIYDIAELSGYSPKTVSRVINNEANVSDKAKKKIKDILKKLDYTPNRYARNLKYRKDKTTLVSIRIPRSYPSKWIQILLEMVGTRCINENITLISEYFYDFESLENSVLSNSSNIIDSVIVFYETSNDSRIKLLHEIDIPYLVYGKPFDDDSSYICSNNEKSVFETFNKFCKKGLSTVLFIASTANLVNIDRIKGVEKALKNNEKDIKGLKIVYDVRIALDGYNYIKENLKKDSLPDIIFVSGDERVPGVLKALRELEISVPHDVSVIGYDDIPLGEFLDPPLSTMKPDYDKLADSIVEFMVDPKKETLEIQIDSQFKNRSSINKKFL